MQLLFKGYSIRLKIMYLILFLGSSSVNLILFFFCQYSARTKFWFAISLFSYDQNFMRVSKYYWHL